MTEEAKHMSLYVRYKVSELTTTLDYTRRNLNWCIDTANLVQDDGMVEDLVTLVKEVARIQAAWALEHEGL